VEAGNTDQPGGDQAGDDHDLGADADPLRLVAIDQHAKHHP
jgi:hypothetical protein